MNVTLIRQEKLEFRWPDGVVESYDPADRYSVEVEGDAGEFIVGYGHRHAFGRERRRVVVFDGRGLWPIIELVGTDEYEQTKNLVWPLKRPGTNARYMKDSQPHQDFLSFTLVRFSEWVTGPYAFTGWAALVGEHDAHTILGLAFIRRRHRESTPSKTSPQEKPAPAKPPGRAAPTPRTTAGDADKLAVAGSLLEYGHRLSDEGATGVVEFVGEPHADEFLRNNGLAFLLAVISDQGVPAERAWILPYRLNQRLGHLDPARIAKTNPSELASVIASAPSLHRFPNMIAEWIVDACRHLMTLGIEAQGIWSAGQTSQEIGKAFESFKGIAQKKSSMAVNILVRDLGVSVGDWENIDVSYDVHVRRVFLRSGLVDQDTEEDVISTARRLSPQYPGALDLPAWYVGRNWCHPSGPACGECAIVATCLRRVELDVDAL